MLSGLAEYLYSTIDGLKWNPDYSAYSSNEVGIYLYRMPYDRARCVALYLSTGEQSSPRLGYDAPLIQVRVRGDVDILFASDLASNIYNQIHGMSEASFVDGTYVIVAVCEQSGPTFIGFDSNQRPEFTVNARFNIHNPTPHREAPIP